MKKAFGIYAVSWAAALGLFNLIVFITPDSAEGLEKFGGAFFAGYVFISTALAEQLLCGFLALRGEQKRLFYRIPLISINYAGLAAMFIFGALSLAIADFPDLVGIIVCFFVILFETAAFFKADAAAPSEAKSRKAQRDGQ